MRNVKFTDMSSELADVLKENGVVESDLFQRYSDLYVGCHDFETANNIKNAGNWRSMSSVFKPQKGSDMERYTAGVDIGLAVLDKYVKDKTHGEVQDS